MLLAPSGDLTGTGAGPDRNFFAVPNLRVKGLQGTSRSARRLLEKAVNLLLDCLRDAAAAGQEVPVTPIGGREGMDAQLQR